MGSCNPFNFDAAACGSGIFGAAVDGLTSAIFGLPVWALLVLAAVLLGFAYKQGGIPGLAAAAAGIGYLLGRRSVKVAHPSNPTQPTKRALTSDEVKSLQAALNALGLDAGPVDGKPGRQTIAAIRQYQVSRGEIATGTPTSAQLKALKVWK
jgi:hypothetical protein